jgi:hypothetical protein
VTTDTFDPLHLRPEASLNRTRLANLPGVDASIVGRSAFEVLSLGAFNALAEDRAATFGRRIADLIASLGQHDPLANRWRQAYLAYWRSIKMVYLGGGLSAALGQVFLDTARRELTRVSESGPHLELAPYPAFLSLIGVARSYLDTPASVAVFDFGQSAVKRGIAMFADGMLEHVHVLPSLPAPAEADVVEFFLDTLRGKPAIVSIASYVTNDLPIDGYGLYSPLATIDRGRLANVAFVHDGTSAARAIVADAPAAAVVLGTALGVGFTPSRSALVPLSARFSLS